MTALALIVGGFDWFCIRRGLLYLFWALPLPPSPPCDNGRQGYLARKVGNVACGMASVTRKMVTCYLVVVDWWVACLIV